jgi:PPOX class probable FMN-dependent enzyme
LTEILTVEQLESIYGVAPALASTAKESTALTPEYRCLVEASPFLALATAGPEGLDCSPRGDAREVLRVLDDRTVVLPDRRGNNRIDSLRNIVRDPRVALLFLIPGSGTTFRINGHATISADAELLASLAVEGKPPRTAIVIKITTCYFQCARAVLRASLWNPASWPDPASLPSPGQILEAMTAKKIDGADYDANWPGRAAASMW